MNTVIQTKSIFSTAELPFPWNPLKEWHHLSLMWILEVESGQLNLHWLGTTANWGKHEGGTTFSKMGSSWDTSPAGQAEGAQSDLGDVQSVWRNFSLSTCQKKSSREFLLKGELFSILWSRFSVGYEQILVKFITRIGPLESLEKGFFPTDFIGFPSLSISAWRKGFRHLRHLLNLCYFCCKPFMSPRISCKWGYLQDGAVGINILKLLSKCDRWKESVQVSTPSHRKFWQLSKSSSPISHYLTFTKQMPHQFQY